MQSKTECRPLSVETGQAAANAGRWETRQELPVETEILIPDYLPAVFKIVKCLLEPVVMQNTVSEHHWQYGGYLRCTVYYQSDEAGANLYRTEQKYAFEKSLDLPELAVCPGAARLWGETEYCNCRAVSERRIDIRGACTLCAAIGVSEPFALAQSLSGCGVEQRTETIRGVLCAACEERVLRAETAFPLPGEGEIVLDISGSFTPSAGIVRTGQLDQSGTLLLQVCSRAPGEQALTVRTKELPVSETFELPDAAEGDEASVWGEVLACTLSAAEAPDADFVLNVTWKLHLELWRSVQYMAAVDAYSTLCDLTLEKKSFACLCPLAAPDTAVPVVIEDDLPDADAVILGCFVTLNAPQLSAAESGGVQAAGRGTAHLICADGRGELTCCDRAFSWQAQECWQAALAQCVPHLHAAVRRVASSRSGAKARVELELHLSGRVLQSVSREVIAAAQPGEEYPDRADGPALYLYYAAKGESLFEIARRYHARAADLAAANHLEVPEGGTAGSLTADGSCLLIPAAL